jgi:hypothetical protein
MMITDSVFLVSVNKTHIQTAIMLPNTKHITSRDQRLLIKNKLNDVIGFHKTDKVTTGRLCLRSDGPIPKIGVYLNSPYKPPSIKRDFYPFQKCKKRFNALTLMDEHGDIKLNKRQLDYLDTKIITHAWVALHNGVAVGLITYPLIKNNTMHDNQFEHFKSIARQALQQFGHVVACDLVIDRENNLKLYNIHEEYEVRGKLISYFTRQVPTTTHLQFKEQE